MNQMNAGGAGASGDFRTNVESIQAEIIRRICFLDYPPGCQLKEAELAEEFGVSRTPVRDAISRIKHLGLVETRNGVGTVVIALSDSQIEQVYEMRLQLATLIGTLSPRPVRAGDVARIDALLDDAVALQRRFDARGYVELNDRLQSLIAEMIGNDVLRSFWMQTYYQAASTWYRVAARMEADAAAALVQELTEMKEALAQGDIAAAGYVQRVHIGYGRGRIRTFLSSDAPGGP